MCQTNSEQNGSMAAVKNGGGNLVKIIYNIPSTAGFADTEAGTVVLPTSAAVDGEITIKLPLVVNSNIPHIECEKPIIHTFEITATQLSSLGIDSETKINFEYYNEEDENMKKICFNYCYMVGPYGPRICKRVCVFSDSANDSAM